MMSPKDNFHHRKTNFIWHSRQDLYDYFIHKGLSIAIIDKTIEDALSSFIVRTNSTINMEELWAKVGKKLLSDIITS